MPEMHLNSINNAIVQDFIKTLTVCTQRNEAFHVTLQTLAKLGAIKAAICMADEAVENKLVVSLSLGMEGASSKILFASTPGKIAAFEAFEKNNIFAVNYHEETIYHPTDLEERLNIDYALYIPINLPKSDKAVGLIIIIPAQHAIFTDEQISYLEKLTHILGEHLIHLAATKNYIEDLSEQDKTWFQNISDAFQVCLNTPNIEDLSDKILEYCLALTKSDFGFVGYIDPKTGFLMTPTMTRNIFDQCKVAGKTVVFEKPSGLGGWVLDNKAPLLANDPFSHPASVGTPPGHLPIRKFMGIPCFFQKDVVGMIALANKDEDYNNFDKDLVTVFSHIYAAVVARFFSEKALTQSRNRFISLYNEAPCGYYTVSPNGIIHEANDTQLHLLGYQREDVINKMNISHFLSKKSEILFNQQVKEAKEKGTISPVELYFKRQDGSLFLALQSGTASFDERGYLSDLRFSILDITEYKKTERALRETRQYLETLFNHSNTPIIVWDANANVVRVNTAFTKMTGYDETEVIGHSVKQLFPANAQINVQNMLENTAKGMYLDSVEMPIRTKSNNIHTILWNSSNLYAEDEETLLATIAQGIDITERKIYETELSKSKMFFNSIVENIPHMIAIKEAKHLLYLYFNKAGEQLLGVTRDHFLGKNDYAVFPKELADKLTARDKAVLAKNKLHDIPEEQVYGSHEEMRYIHTKQLPILDENGETSYLLSISEDITKRKESEQRLHFLAYYDNLTTLPNRAMFNKKLKTAIQHAEIKKAHVVVLFFDLDRFKVINDTLGHRIGDALLQSVAERLLNIVQEIGGIVARLGGDEFAIILENVERPKETKTVAEKILQSLSSPFYLENNEVVTTTSIGISSYPVDATNESDLLKNADIAMYHAKELGRNNFQFFSEDTNAVLLEKMIIETHLRYALDKNEMTVYYQPQIDLITGKVIGMEALLRWRHATKGMIPPDKFIPIAEESGYILQLGEWVMYTACMQKKKWYDMGFDLRLAVNLSPRQVMQGGVAQLVKRIITETSLDKSTELNLELELTENTLMEHIDTALLELEKLKELGVQLSIDDFGTGYSSLSYLRRFSIDTLKIDKSFVQDITKDQDDEAICAAIIAMAHTLNLSVIAEGVETQDQVNFLRQHKCDVIQGYFYGRPMPADEFTRYLQENS